MTRLLLAIPACAALLSAQVADYANTNYRTEEGRAKVAQGLNSHDREQTQKPRDLVAQLKLAPGMTVADIGTGVGFMLPYLHEAVGAEGKVVAEDIFPDFLEKAKANAAAKKLDNVTFVHGTVKDPKLPTEAVDVALVLDAYHHFDFPAEMLSGLRAGLKPGGRLVIVDFYKSGFRDPKHIRLDEKDVIKEIEANGFELIGSGPFTKDRQYLAAFRKK
ncbi:MAG: methyltransferase domain-containing protein [Bryobacterales bacterium]|nr:methyltransferase domain-containing protein [Bryobacterales bacterium]